MEPTPSYDPKPTTRQSALSTQREPFVPPRHVLDQVDGRLLDPGTALSVKGVRPRSTVYVGPRLMVSLGPETATTIERLQQVAETLGWQATVHPDDEPNRPEKGDPAGAFVAGQGDRPRIGVVRLDLSVRDERATAAPDGWVLLQHARAAYGIEAMSRVGLDHIVLVRSIEPNPFHGSQPFHGSHPAGGTESPAVATYSVPGSGGRQPMTYVGPAPVRRTDSEVVGRRPVVATLDTGCGKHPWLAGVVQPGPGIDSRDIGYVDDPTDPEKWFDQVGALDGGIDPLAGHGTFIAGLIHQACPDADIVAWRIVGSDGPVVESALVKALGDISEVARRHRDGQEGGHPIDVLSLSLGYYHETPEDLLFDPTMYEILRVLGECGVSVVCSAGNDATARPMFPAAFAPWADGSGGAAAEAGVVPVVSVGALNPNGTDALFSNAGPWVRAYAPGAAVMSTLPPFQGGLEPQARSEAYMRQRESIDPDDFSGSFALWSGTSFSAPLFAGQVAAELVDSIDPDEDGRPAAVKRTWQALTSLTDLAP
jgi:serine protease